MTRANERNEKKDSFFVGQDNPVCFCPFNLGTLSGSLSTKVAPELLDEKLEVILYLIKPAEHIGLPTILTCQTEDTTPD